MTQEFWRLGLAKFCEAKLSLAHPLPVGTTPPKHEVIGLWFTKGEGSHQIFGRFISTGGRDGGARWRGKMEGQDGGARWRGVSDLLGIPACEAASLGYRSICESMHRGAQANWGEFVTQRAPAVGNSTE